MTWKNTPGHVSLSTTAVSWPRIWSMEYDKEDRLLGRSGYMDDGINVQVPTTATTTIWSKSVRDLVGMGSDEQQSTSIYKFTLAILPQKCTRAAEPRRWNGQEKRTAMSKWPTTQQRKTCSNSSVVDASIDATFLSMPQCTPIPCASPKFDDKRGRNPSSHERPTRGPTKDRRNSDTPNRIPLAKNPGFAPMR